MTADHPEEPTVPVRDLRELIEEWHERADGNEEFGYEYDGAAYRSAATELEELVAEYE